MFASLVGVICGKFTVLLFFFWFDFYFDYWDFNFQRAGSYREREYEYYGGYSGDRSYYDSR